MIEVKTKKSKQEVFRFFFQVDSSVGDVEGALENIKQESSYFQIITRDYKVRNFPKC